MIALLSKRVVRAWGAGLLVFVSACSSTVDKPQPAALPAVSGGLVVTRAWTLNLAPVDAPLQMSVQGQQVLLASQNGWVAEIDANTGKTVWQLQLPHGLTAGMGSDGRRHAVVSVNNELIVLQDGRELWRQRLAAQTYTAPWVGGERVFVQTGDRSVMAFDGRTGQRLWNVPRSGEPLVLRQSGVLTAVGDTLLSGNGGRLGAIQPLTGQLRWEVLIGSSRGTNEVERLVDLVAGVSRQGSVVCVRAFQTAVGCVDTARGQTLWTRPAQGHVGLDGDESRVFGVESDSKLRAWSRSDGQLMWSQEDYRFRELGAPRLWGRVLVMGDGQGLLHLLDRNDGRTLARLSTDGSALRLQPVVAGRTLVTVNRSGLVTGWRAD